MLNVTTHKVAVVLKLVPNEVVCRLATIAASLLRPPTNTAVVFGMALVIVAAEALLEIT